MSARETDVLKFTDDNLQCLIDCIQDVLSDELDTCSYYPIGYIYRTSKAPADGGDPNDLFPGTTWVRLKDAYVRAASSSDTVDSDPEHDTPRGSNTRSAADLPRHGHGILYNSSHYTSADSAVSGSCNWLLADYYNKPSTQGKISYSESGGYWYGENKSPANEKKCALNVGGITHNHSIAVNENSEGSANMDIQPKHLYKYYWERTA